MGALYQAGVGKLSDVKRNYGVLTFQFTITIHMKMR